MQTSMEFGRERGSTINETMDLTAINNSISMMPSKLLLNNTMGVGMPLGMENGAANKRWVVCFTNCIRSQEKSEVTLELAARTYIKNQINIVLICYDLDREDERLAKSFIAQMKATNEEGIAQCEAHLLLDPASAEVERLFERRLANFKI